MTSSRSLRVRVFAGPNGSGKSTLLHKLTEELPLYRVINPDEIERKLGSESGLDLLDDFGINATPKSFLGYVAGTTYPATVKRAASEIEFSRSTLFCRRTTRTSYNAALVSAFLRSKLINASESFSYESVFSHPSKLAELEQAKSRGYRIYLSFVATEAPEVGIGRVKERVAGGGHSVPVEKNRKRYTASLLNLCPAIELAYRAYIFDNSGREARRIAEKTPHGNLHLHTEHIPVWFATHVLDKLDIR